MRPITCSLLPLMLAGLTGSPLAGQSTRVAYWGDIQEEAHSAATLAHAEPLQRPVVLDLSGVALWDALRSVAAQVSLELAYSRDVEAADRRVSLRARGLNAATALRLLLHGTGLTFLIPSSGHLAVVRAPPAREGVGDAALPPVVRPPTEVTVTGRPWFVPVKIQQGAVSGRVTDGATGAPIAGATVVVEGTRFGATTDLDGRYAIGGVPSGTHRVSASRIGYAARVATVSVAAGQTSTATFVLEQQAITLDGVVAVGYGVQARRDITGAIATVNLDDVQTAPVASVDQMLQGRAPGVQVTQHSGAPGGGSSVRIRGTSSIAASSEPLYVIDGVPAFVGGMAGREGRTGLPENPLSYLSPNEIESIEILKDASAAAIYGSRGANGVVLITTRRGIAGENTVQLQSSYGMQEITRTIPLLNGRQYAELVNEVYANRGQAAYFSTEDMARIGEGTDWQEELFRTAPVQNHTITASGGDERTRYLVSGNFFDQRGIIDNSGFQRYSARINLDRGVSERFRIGSNLTLSRTDANIATNNETDVFANVGAVVAALWAAPTQPVRDAEGNYEPYAALFQPTPNPIASTLEITNDRVASRVVGSVFGEFDFTDALRFRSSVGGSALFQQEDFYAPTYIPQGANLGGDASRSSAQSAEVLNENILTYRRALRGGRDRVDMTGGFTRQTFRLESVSARAQQFATDITRVNALSAGALPLSPGSGANEWALLSWLGRANYHLSDRYLFTLTGRYDGSSKFGERNKWGFFPSGALAWRLSEEPFLQSVDWISDLKLRTSYGVTGNQEIGTYASLARLTTSEYELDRALKKGYAPGVQAPNRELKWESTGQFDVGVDLALFDQRAVLVADYYRSVTRDLLLTIDLPATTGYGSQLQNVGSVRNWGVELGLNTRNVERDDFTWSTSLNLSRNRNEVLALGAEEEFVAGGRNIGARIGGGTSLIRVGEPLGTFFGYQTKGIWQIGDACDLAEARLCVPGTYRYVDVNGDRQITAADRAIIGSAQPAFLGGMTNNFTVGPLSLDVFLSGTYGNDVANMAAIELRSVSFNSNQSVQTLDRWTPENPSNTVPRASDQPLRQLLDVFIEDGSYLRLQNVTLGYQLPDRLLPGGERARVYVSGQHLWTWTGYSGYDPEVNSFADDPLARGVDMDAYPRARTINVGLDLNF